MKVLLLPIILLVSVPSLAQLCQGAYYTEEQGAQQLAKARAEITSFKSWFDYSYEMKRHLRTGMELNIPPDKTPLNPKYRGKQTMDGYTIENVIFESVPGFYVTGNLYRPTGNLAPQSLAAIVCPHGHWDQPEDYGRFRADMQYRCAAFAKMGAVVFSIDMIGYGESQQLDHKYPKGVAIQTWNVIRSVDLLTSLPEVDAKRVAVTGASGGGTQTFLATALDERIAVAIPVVQVSAHFFGGCACESGMPIHRNGDKVYSNVEIAALAAPRPMLVISDGEDWTKNTPKVEFPFLQHIYKLTLKEDAVENAHFAKEGHDYGKNKRLAAYNFLAKHLGMNIDKIKNKKGVVDESFVKVADRKSLEYFQPGETKDFIKGDEVWAVFTAPTETPMIESVAIEDRVEEDKGDDETIYTIVEEQPAPPIPIGEYISEITKKIVFPKEAIKQKAEGNVYVEFVIRKDGSLTDFQVVKSIWPTLDAEVIRVMREGPKWRPGVQGGQAKNVRFIIPIKLKAVK
jgi:TonB family protein